MYTTRPTTARQLAVYVVLMLGAVVLLATSQPRWELSDSATAAVPAEGQEVALTFDITPGNAAPPHIGVHLELTGDPAAVATLRRTTWTVSSGDDARTFRFNSTGSNRNRAWARFSPPPCESNATCTIPMKLTRADQEAPAPPSADNPSTTAATTATAKVEVSDAVLKAVQMKLTVSLEGRGEQPSNVRVKLKVE